MGGVSQFRDWGTVLNIAKRFHGITISGLLRAIALVIVMAGQTQASPMVGLQSAPLQLSQGEIAWIASAGNYVELHIDRRSVLHRQTLTSLIQQLDPDQFMRVHRSAAVNRDHVAELLNTATGSYSLRLRSGVEVPVSDRHRDDIKRQLGLKD